MRTPEPPPGGKRQILIMSQPKGSRAYEQPRGGQTRGWAQPVYKKKREATTQMLPKHAGVILVGDPPLGTLFT